MTVYEWTESEHFFIAQVRPEELFDLSTLDSLPDWDKWNDPTEDHGPEGFLNARNRLTGDRGTYAYFVDKRAGKAYAERILSHWPDRHVANDTRSLGLLRKQRALANTPG